MSVYATLLDEIAKNIIPTILVPTLVILSNIIYQHFLSEKLKLRKARNFWIKTTLKSNKSVDECIHQFEDTVDTGILYFLLQPIGVAFAFYAFLCLFSLFFILGYTKHLEFYLGLFLFFPLIFTRILKEYIQNLDINEIKKLSQISKIIINLSTFIWWFTFTYFFIWIILNFNVSIHVF